MALKQRHIEKKRESCSFDDDNSVDGGGGVGYLLFFHVFFCVCVFDYMLYIVYWCDSSL